MNELTLDSVERFLDRLASADPTPGGGGAAAMMGAMGAALISMVCNLTIGKADYAASEADMMRLRDDAEALRGRLTAMIADDAAAFDALMASYRLPKSTDVEKAARSDAIQSALKGATEAPLACARACAAVIRACQPAAERGNKNVVSDAGAAVLSAWAGLRSAALNVLINAPSIRDKAYTQARITEVDALRAECEVITEAVVATVRGKLG